MSEAELYRRVVLAVDVVDTESLPFTIALLYPKMRILSLSYPTEAAFGQAISVGVELINDGVEGPGWVELIEVDTGIVVGPRAEQIILPARAFWIYWDLVMPDKDWVLQLRAGHYE